MYTTKPLSLLKRHPEAAAEPPPEGRNSGYLVVKATTDEEDDETTCWCTTRRVLELPFPQNRVLSVVYSDDDEVVVFVPVADQPVASNRYHAVIASGLHKGLVRACSREEDTTTCCFCRYVSDVEPRPFDPADVYQQMEIVQHKRGCFTARAVAADGLPPSIYRSKYWAAYESKKIDLGEAPGLDASLRSRQLGAFPASATAVGKWYCPFFLIKEDGVRPRKQMGRSAFYEVALEQRWEPARGDAVVHARDRSKLASKKALIGGSVEAEQVAGNSRHGDGGFHWFRAGAAGQRVGVCRSVWERMLWEQSRGGWVDEEKVAAGNVVDDGSVVLVERFVVKRMDGSVAVAFDFVHHNQVRLRAERV